MFENMKKNIQGNGFVVLIVINNNSNKHDVKINKQGQSEIQKINNCITYRHTTYLNFTLTIVNLNKEEAYEFGGI